MTRRSDSVGRQESALLPPSRSVGMDIESCGDLADTSSRYDCTTFILLGTSTPLGQVIQSSTTGDRNTTSLASFKGVHIPDAGCVCIGMWEDSVETWEVLLSFGY